MTFRTKAIIFSLALIFSFGCDDHVTEQCAELDPLGDACEHDSDCDSFLCECVQDNWLANPECVDGQCQGVEASCAGEGRPDEGACEGEGGWTGDCS